MVVPASITSMVVLVLFTSSRISFVSRAEERLLTDDRLPVSAFKISARLLMLFEEGSCATRPKTFGLLFIVIDEFNLTDVKLLEIEK